MLGGGTVHNHVPISVTLLCDSRASVNQAFEKEGILHASKKYKMNQPVQDWPTRQLSTSSFLPQLPPSTFQ